MQENSAHIVDRLRAALLSTMQNQDMQNGLLAEATFAIQKALQGTECSLWSINRNNTDVEGKKGKGQETLSTSLIRREVNHFECMYQFQNKEDCTHTIKLSFFEKVIESFSKDDPYQPYSGEEAIKDGFKSQGFIKNEGGDPISNIIVVPITDAESSDKVIAIFEISYIEKNTMISIMNVL